MPISAQTQGGPSHFAYKALNNKDCLHRFPYYVVFFTQTPYYSMLCSALYTNYPSPRKRRRDGGEGAGQCTHSGKRKSAGVELCAPRTEPARRSGNEQQKAFSRTNRGPAGVLSSSTGWFEVPPAVSLSLAEPFCTRISSGMK